MTPNLIVCNDTNYWFDSSDTTGQKLIPYPNNSKVSFDENFKFGDTIPNCEVRLGHDTIFIKIFQITYGLRVYLDITCIDSILTTKLIHDRANIGIMRTFKVDKCELTLNKRQFRKQETLVGKLNLHFLGHTQNVMTGKEEKVKGQLSGLFKAQVE